MVITHHGGQCFKVTLGDLTIVFDPIAKGATLPSVRFGADIALVSRNHKDMNGVEEVTYGGKAPFAITGPGEYERGGIVVRGFISKSEYGLAKGQSAKTSKGGSPDGSQSEPSREAVNTIYSVELEDMTLVHLGALSDIEISHEAREGIDNIDVLFVPVGGDGVLSPEDANKIAVLLEPKVIVPMHWSGVGEPKSLEAFLKASGQTGQKVDKLTLKKKDLAGLEGSILILTP